MDYAQGSSLPGAGSAAAFDPARERVAYLAASYAPGDEWVAAGVGTEVPLIRDGRWQLYVWNPARRAHGWLDLATDIVTED